jgi:hypothetical protein
MTECTCDLTHTTFGCPTHNPKDKMFYAKIPGGKYKSGQTFEVDLQPVIQDNKCVLDEAKEIVDGARQANYGPPEDNFSAIGRKWAVTLDIIGWRPGDPIPPRIVALMMIDLKTCRDAFQPKRDNAVDIAGYVYCASKFTQNKDS